MNKSLKAKPFYLIEWVQMKIMFTFNGSLISSFPGNVYVNTLSVRLESVLSCTLDLNLTPFGVWVSSRCNLLDIRVLV